MLVKTQGEKYRHMLEKLVKKLGVQDKVIFVNKFLDDEELGQYLYLTDVYLSPYPNRDQAVSGTMAFALGCGRAIVSTPYAYAREMLANGTGLLSKGTDPEELAQLLRQVLSDRTLKMRLQDKAARLGKSWTWSNIGKQYVSLARSILMPEATAKEGVSVMLDDRHLRKMTDDVGMLQFSKSVFLIPAVVIPWMTMPGL